MNLADRLERHNRGQVQHSSKYRPWPLNTAIRFSDRHRAVAFERYLKTASGRAWGEKLY